VWERDGGAGDATVEEETRMTGSSG
jgi:hypothetical protein